MGSCRARRKRSSPNFSPKTTMRRFNVMQEKLLEVSLCPDFIEDRGHTFGRDLSDQDKQALIEYMKYF